MQKNPTFEGHSVRMAKKQKQLKVAVVGTADRLEDFSSLTIPGVKLETIDQFEVDVTTMKGQLNMLAGEESDIPDDEWEESGIRSEIDWESFDVVIDLGLDDYPENIANYADCEGLIVIGCAVKMTLSEIGHAAAGDLACHLFGMNCLPTFLTRARRELSVYQAESLPVLRQLMADWGWEYDLVDDRVGMVSPRVVCMIINEACYVLQEGTASKEAIDQAMKLGTNYPRGPFEWADAIGVKDVYEVLESLQEETGEEKYKIAALLRTHFLKDEPFYN